jgi:hypothetical protein
VDEAPAQTETSTAGTAAARPGPGRFGLDRFTLVIVAALGLVALALGLVLARPSEGRPMDEATPLGVANNYYLALAEGDTRRAYEYLSSEAKGKTAYEEFARRQLPRRETRRLWLDDERIDGDTARVSVRQSHGTRSFLPFDSGEYTTRYLLVLRREGGAWKLTQPDYR